MKLFVFDFAKLGQDMIGVVVVIGDLNQGEMRATVTL